MSPTHERHPTIIILISYMYAETTVLSCQSNYLDFVKSERTNQITSCDVYATGVRLTPTSILPVSLNSPTPGFNPVLLINNLTVSDYNVLYMSIRNDGLLTPFRVIDKELAWFLFELIWFFFLGGGGYLPGIFLMKFPNAFDMYIKTINKEVIN